MICHLVLDIRGALCRTDNELEAFGFVGADGTVPTGAEIREFLLDHLQQGHRVLPMSDECEGFDYAKGCPGHDGGEGESPP